MKPSVLSLFLAALSVPAFAQLNDAPAVNVKDVLQGLRQFKEQNESGLKTRRNAAYQQVTAAAASADAAANFWTTSVMAVQIAGVDRENAAAKDWLRGEGEGFKAAEAKNAARLHLLWLALTLQHVSDAETKQLLPNVIDFTKQLEADELAIGRVSEHLDRLVDRLPGAKGRNLQETERNLVKASGGKPIAGVKEALADVRAILLHNKILRTAVAESPVAQKLGIVEILGTEGSKKKKKPDAPEAAPGGPGWEPVPGNVKGIYQAIILPEFRDKKDPRLMDYWDMMLRKNQASVYAGMPTFEERQLTQVERPNIQWDRTQDMLLLGLRNRAITEMFNLIKAYPQHPDAAGWIGTLEGMLAPAPGPTGTTSGTVAPPVAVPSATNPPTAVIVPGAR